jgi:hypothetical protein
MEAPTGSDKPIGILKGVRRLKSVASPADWMRHTYPPEKISQFSSCKVRVLLVSATRFPPFRLSLLYSKRDRFENHVWMVELYTVFYDFVKIHKTLRVTPAMQAGLGERVLTFEELVGIIDAAEVRILSGV